jgi:hypothetical protein
MNMNMAPRGNDPIGWIIVAAGTIVTVWTIAAAVYWTLRPGETDPDHPKNMVLKDNR